MTSPSRQQYSPVPKRPGAAIELSRLHKEGRSPGSHGLPLAGNEPEPPAISPLAASAYAESLLGFWRALKAQGKLDSSGTLDILDLLPGSGVTAWLLLQAVLKRLEATPELPFRVRYLAAARKRDMLGQLRAQPELQAWIEQGQLVPVLWDPARGKPCLLTPQKRLPWTPANPVAVLTHDLWSRLEQRLLAVHYGALLEADIAELAGNARPEQEARLWHPARQEDLPAGVAKRREKALGNRGAGQAQGP